MSGFDNEVLYAIGERLEPSTTQAITIMQKTGDDVSRVNIIGSPEGVVSANPSSLAHDRVSGNVYIKATGTSTTGWKIISEGVGIDLINGDQGSITGNSVTIYTNNLQLTPGTTNSGSSVKFVGDNITTMILRVTDESSNTIIGEDAGNLTFSSSQNTIVGASAGFSMTSGSGGNCLFGYTCGDAMTDGEDNSGYGANSLGALTTGDDNCAFGDGSLALVTTGSSNIALGSGAGVSCTGASSNNIYIGNAGAVESAAIRIGTQGTQTTHFAAGITGVTVSNAQNVTIDSTTGQLGAINGGWVKITTVNASNSTSLTITSGISSIYNSYALVFSNVNPTSNGNLTLQISSDGGATYKATNYFSGFNNFTYNSTTFSNVNGTTAFFICQTNTNYFSSGCVYFNSFTDGQYPAMTGDASTTNPASEIIRYINTGVYRTQITVNAVSIANSAGNLSVGAFTLYGLVK